MLVKHGLPLPHTPPFPSPLLQGYQSAGRTGLVLGVLKGAVGLLGRPAVGVVEASSKFFNAVALTALGRCAARAALTAESCEHARLCKAESIRLGCASWRRCHACMRGHLS